MGLGLPHPFGVWSSSTDVIVPTVADYPCAVELVTSKVVLPPGALPPKPYVPVTVPRLADCTHNWLPNRDNRQATPTHAPHMIVICPKDDTDIRLLISFV